MPSTHRSRGLAAAALALALGAGSARGASHREAPLMTLDPAADITDVYAFVSYDAANLARPPQERKVTLIMNAVPGQEPGSGPNYFAFDDNVLYELKVDNNRDGQADDVVYQFRFKTETTSPEQFIYPVAGVGPLPPVTAPDGAGATGLARIQRYTVTELRNCRDKKKGPKCQARPVLFDGKAKPYEPSNTGSRTPHNY